MELKDIARRLPEDIWEIFEPLLPPVVWCGNGRPPKSNKDCLHGLLFVLVAGIAWELLPPCWPSYKTIQRRLHRWLSLDVFRMAWGQLAQQYEQLYGINWDQILLDGSKKPSKKGGEETGPSPVDRAKSGTALHLACDARAMPLGVVVTKANANDGCQTAEVLTAMVVQPPPPVVSIQPSDPRDLPRAQADGAYGNKPTQERAQRAGFRMQAPKRGENRQGVGKIRNAVERCHNFLAQFGRIFRRFDRSARRYLAWIEMAACVIFVRSSFVR
jgi:transposase